MEKCLRKTEELLLQEHEYEFFFFCSLNLPQVMTYMHTSIKGAKAMLELLDMPRLIKLEEVSVCNHVFACV